jgi:delta14-sterol reductase
MGPVDIVSGMAAPVVAYLVITALHLALPARHVDGYVRDATGAKLRYRLNGLWVFVATVALWAASCAAGVLPWDFLYTHRWPSFAGAFLLGLLFTAVVVLREPSTGKSLPADLFFGRAENPQWFGARIDAKMWLYLVGAVMLALNLLSAAAHHALRFPDDPNPGVFLHVALFSWFLCEYLFFEEVHLYTYDFVAERTGFKLGWGCLTFYPYFYGIGLFALADAPDASAPGWLLVLAVLVFFLGWSLARGANMQKYTFKTRPDAKFLGRIAPETVTDGTRTLLVNGFWGVSRHVNYLGEILMASGLALALGQPWAWAPWLYPLYYVALLVPRQIDDDARFAAKYGPLWATYLKRVPYRIVPFVW